MVDLSPDQQLALAYVPAARREAVRALWSLDETLAQAALGGREPMLRRIKLAWWREALERLDAAPAPAEPTLQAVASFILPAGIPGGDLAVLENGWAAIADEPTADNLKDYAIDRGAALAELTSRLLGESEPDWLRSYAEAWALAELRRRGVETGIASEAVLAPRTWPVRLRPLGMLMLPVLEPTRSGPRRLFRMLRHRLTGR